MTKQIKKKIKKIEGPSQNEYLKNTSHPLTHGSSD